ncbi:hypothetical protein ACFPZ0_23780 [Streptomonospora nanhaiensis]|uniref:Uncharacterized membrane protein HdeD (DUF308 family) n=1 Tax=Streptomonospora nanhaiensis TaxID=1323731 RepID=A0A853BQC1_9ACTN|nr:hypothetical protein [Streptomonospora nanhaiensis]MBV2367184.1 hypothetical protein [Streptomonospora nanhaiensis]MBX9391210.1 hypothetical protein [Streptomonospora nanhaiensis]NYI97628.1 uncharacterized membrane protein HdeD (DUF308 family) [Streptomonospora nanhaiensis]
MWRHRTDWGSLIAGLLFIVLGTAFILGGPGRWGLDTVWIVPVVAVGLGIAGVARALAASRDRHGPTESGRPG